MLLRRLLAFLALALLCLPGPVGAQTFPKLTGRVVDGANLLQPAQEQALDAQLADLERQTRRQLVVVTVPDLQGYDIADYGYRLGRAWGIGDKVRNDGALLIVAPNDRKVRIEVGYGLEGVLTDAASSLIIQNAIVPRFKEGDFAGGITAGVSQIVTLLRLSPEEARKWAAQLQAEAEQEQRMGNIVAMLFFFGFIGLFFVRPMLFGGGRRMGGMPVILWGPGSGSGWGGGGGGSSWGGGGGFSGGGGSFGGGGSSGSW